MFFLVASGSVTLSVVGFMPINIYLGGFVDARHGESWQETIEAGAGQDIGLAAVFQFWLYPMAIAGLSVS